MTFYRRPIITALQQIGYWKQPHYLLLNFLLKERIFKSKIENFNNFPFILFIYRLCNVSTYSCTHLTIILSSSSCLCHSSLLPTFHLYWIKLLTQIARSSSTTIAVLRSGALSNTEFMHRFWKCNEIPKQFCVQLGLNILPDKPSI